MDTREQRAPGGAMPGAGPSAGAGLSTGRPASAREARGTVDDRDGGALLIPLVVLAVVLGGMYLVGRFPPDPLRHDEGGARPGPPVGVEPLDSAPPVAPFPVAGPIGVPGASPVTVPSAGPAPVR